MLACVAGAIGAVLPKAAFTLLMQSAMLPGVRIRLPSAIAWPARVVQTLS